MIDLEQQTDLRSVWFQITRKMVNTIWFRYDLRRFRKVFFAWFNEHYSFDATSGIYAIADQGKNCFEKKKIVNLFQMLLPLGIMGDQLHWENNVSISFHIE